MWNKVGGELDYKMKSSFKCFWQEVLLAVFLLIAFFNIHSSKAMAHDKEFPREGDDIMRYNVITMRDTSEVIAIATLSTNTVAPAYTRQYNINGLSTLKGMLAVNSVLIQHPSTFSSLGSDAVIEPERQYLLFLEKATKLSMYDNQTNTSFYQIVKLWKGATAFDKTAKEQRAVDAIKEAYGVSIADKVDAFAEAIKFSVDNLGNATNAPISTMSADAKVYWETFKLERVHTPTRSKVN